MTTLKFNLVLGLAIWTVLVEAIYGNILYDDVKVAVVNGLSGKRVLLVHCKSKDDDLGPHYVPIAQEYSWEFTPNVWGSTLFWCYVAPDKNSHISFDAFKDRVSLTDYCDSRSGVTTCVWIAKDDGIYLRDFSNGGNAVFKFKWEPGLKLGYEIFF